MTARTKTKTCQQCGNEFQYTRSTARFCSSACRLKALRLRRAKPVSLERLTKSQRRNDRPHDSHVQRPQQLGLRPVLPLGQHEVRDSPGETGRKRTTSGAPRTSVSGWKAIEWRDSVFEEALRLVRESPTARFARLQAEAEAEFVWYVLGGFICANEYSDGIPSCRHEDHAKDDGAVLRLVRWVVRWRHAPGLTARDSQKIIRGVATEFLEIRADLRHEKELRRRMQLETIAAQNEELLFEVKKLRAEQLEQRALLIETAERVRERFPNDTEVSAAVDRFLNEIGS